MEVISTYRHLLLLNHESNQIALIRDARYTHVEDLDVAAEVWKRIFVRNDSYTTSISALVHMEVISTCRHLLLLNEDSEHITRVRGARYSREVGCHVAAEVWKRIFVRNDSYIMSI